MNRVKYVEIRADDDFTIRDWISERWMKSWRFLLRERFISPSLREAENTVNSYERKNPCSSRQAESDIRVYSPVCRSFSLSGRDDYSDNKRKQSK